MGHCRGSALETLMGAVWGVAVGDIGSCQHCYHYPPGRRRFPPPWPLPMEGQGRGVKMSLVQWGRQVVFQQQQAVSCERHWPQLSPPAQAPFLGRMQPRLPPCASESHRILWWFSCQSSFGCRKTLEPLCMYTYLFQ